MGTYINTAKKLFGFSKTSLKELNASNAGRVLKSQNCILSARISYNQ